MYTPVGFSQGASITPTKACKKHSGSYAAVTKRTTRKLMLTISEILCVAGVGSRQHCRPSLVAVGIWYETLWPYWEYGTTTLAILQAFTVPHIFELPQALNSGIHKMKANWPKKLPANRLLQQSGLNLVCDRIYGILKGGGSEGDR